jgi:hypothetical protein
LSRKLQTNCAISYYFYIYLMLYACAASFNVTENLKNFERMMASPTFNAFARSANALMGSQRDPRRAHGVQGCGKPRRARQARQAGPPGRRSLKNKP